MDNINRIIMYGYCRLLSLVKRAIRIVINIPIRYNYNNFFIQLPPNHMLPIYQKFYPKYDKFLPHVVKYIELDKTIIDVGANVGDTLAGMVEQNSLVHYICVEADDFFYELLEKNIANISKSTNNIKVEAIKRLVGKNVSNVILEGKGGTKHAVLNEPGGIKSVSLDELVNKSAVTEVRLLKIDVDGFDYDVIDSALLILTKDAPILFFELQLDYKYQIDGYIRTINNLDSIGYCDWTVFDNFGEVVLRTDQVNILFQLMNYVWNQNVGNSTRTIHYYDILAIQKKDAELIGVVLKEYNQL